MVVKQCRVFDRAILQIKRWERQRKFEQIVTKFEDKGGGGGGR